MNFLEFTLLSKTISGYQRTNEKELKQGNCINHEWNSSFFVKIEKVNLTLRTETGTSDKECRIIDDSVEM